MMGDSRVCGFIMREVVMAVYTNHLKLLIFSNKSKKLIQKCKDTKSSFCLKHLKLVQITSDRMELKLPPAYWSRLGISNSLQGTEIGTPAGDNGPCVVEHEVGTS